VRRESPNRSAQEVRSELGVAENEKLLLVTTGGGEDGFHILSASVDALKRLSRRRRIKSVIVGGPELSQRSVRQIRIASESCPGVRVFDFLDDMISYMNAADVVVSMAGYNTVCELLTLGKKSVLVPRVTPVEEQKIRAERLARVPFLRTILPNELSATRLAQAIEEQLQAAEPGICPASVDMGALQRITEMLARNNWGTDTAGFELPAATRPEVVSQ
jgi:predicted glycosyltransferase